MSLPVLRTDRLLLRPVGADDLPFLVTLNADPDVMTYVLGRPASADETAAEWAERLGPRTHVARGLGYWIGHLDGDPVGWWGVAHHVPDPTTCVLGYRLRRSWWGHGLATEGARTVLLHGLGAPGVLRCAAATSAANAPSRHVLEKLGMQHVRTVPANSPEPHPGSLLGDTVYETSRVPDDAQ